MFLTLLEKITTVFTNAFSSFAGVESTIIVLLLFLFLVLNAKFDNKIVKCGFLVIVLSIIFTTVYLNQSYAVYSIDYLIKAIMNYIYFPSTVIYFVIVICSGIFMIISNFRKCSKFRKVLDSIFFSSIYFLFFNFIIAVSNAGLDLADKVSLYKNDLVLSIIQLSNLIFVVWLIVMFFYKLYNFFKKKYD